MKRALVILIPAVLLVLPGLFTDALGDTGEEFFIQGNQAYRDGRYSEAAQAYERLVASGHASGHLFYNLGNAYFRMDRIGRAILNYERARLLIPRDADLSFNLSRAQDRRQDAVSPPEKQLEKVFFWLGSFNTAELFLAFAVANAALFLALLLRLSVRGEWTYYAVVTFLFLWLTSGLTFGLKYYGVSFDKRAVVVAPRADILAGPEKGDTVLFRLHEGTVVRSERSEAGWMLISLPDGKRGWVRGSEVEGIVRGEDPQGSLLSGQTP